MKGSSSGFENAKPYLLMVFLQFGMAGMYLATMVVLDRGMNRYVFIVYRNASAALFFGPFALVLERQVRPKMTLSIFMQILLLGFLEPVLDQGFTCMGMKYTSASFASAVMNAVPSVTFLIALVFRLEKIKMKEIRSQAKAIGTVISLGGALLMTLYKGPIVNMFGSTKGLITKHGSGGTNDNHRVLGTLLLLVGCVAWSCFYVVQSITINKYPASLSLTTLICLAGSVQSTIIALIMEPHSKGWAVGLDYRIYSPLYAGIVASGITYYVQGLVMKTRGPVFVTAFNPLCMIIVAVLGSFILGEQIHLGSIIGGVIIAVGLYSVVWGKSKDYISMETELPVKRQEAEQQLPAISKDASMQ